MGKWYVSNTGYARKTLNYIKENGEPSSKALLMHREIMGLSPGDGLEVDHISGDRLDNRKCNLRICTPNENSLNRGLYKNNTSTYKGVVFHKNHEKFMAQIAFGKKNVHLGYFECPKEAAAAYNAAAQKYFGEFAKLNQI